MEIVYSNIDTVFRSLDGGEQEDRGGAIDSVARANSIPPEQTSHMLPEIRAAPCPIHFKRDMDKGHDLLFSTTSYVRDVKMFKRFQPHPIKHIPIYQRGSSQQTLRGNKLGVSVRVPRQYPVKPSTLPEPCRPKITSCPGLCTVLPHKDQTTFLILYKDH